MDFEDDHKPYELRSKYAIGNSDVNLHTFLWKNASNNRNFNIAVVKVNTELYFFDNNAEVVTGKPLNKGQPITLPQFGGNQQLKTPIKWDFASVHGYLLVTTGTQDVYILTYDFSKDSIKFVAQELKIRDLFGIDIVIPDDERPLTLSEMHKYNLRNQGWVPELQCAWKGAPSNGEVDTIAWTNADALGAVHLGRFPSNADMVWANRPETVDNALAVNSYDPFEMTKATYNKQEAPKGRYVINLFERGASRKEVSEPEGVDWTDFPEEATERSVGGITAVASFMGRAVYAVNEIERVNEDDRSPYVGSMIYISQAKTERKALTLCHSQLDPTAGLEFAQLATDGGFVPISGMGFVNSIVPQGNSLFIFTDRGVWQMSGGDRLFTMTNMNINQLSSVGSLCKDSVTDAEGNLFYLSDGGIYLLAGMGQESTQAESVNITQDTIQTLYDSVSQTGKRNAVSYYDKFTRQVKWLFQTAPANNNYFFDTEVIYDLNLQAFSINRIKNYGLELQHNPYVIGFLERENLTNVERSEDVTVNGEQVTALGDPVVFTTRRVADLADSSNKYWNLYANGLDEFIDVSEYKHLKFLDWQAPPTRAGVDANAFMLTGHATAGDSAVFKRIPYITTHMRRTEEVFQIVEDGFIADNPSSCTLQVYWDWTDKPEAGKWSNPQEIYRLPRTFVFDDGSFDYGHTVITTKTRLRGKGRAFSLLYKTKPLHDCHLFGWSLELDAENNV